MYVVDESSPIQPKDTEPSRDIVLGLISKPTLDGESRQLAKNRRGLIMDFRQPRMTWRSPDGTGDVQGDSQGILFWTTLNVGLITSTDALRGLFRSGDAVDKPVVGIVYHS
jgi:hypothetical protein